MIGGGSSILHETWRALQYAALALVRLLEAFRQKLRSRNRRLAMARTAALAREPADQDPWRSFNPGDWRTSINVRDFIVRNMTPYAGDASFLASPTARTKAVWAK